MIWTLFLEHSIEQKVCPLCDATYIFLFWNPSQATCLSLLFSVLSLPYLLTSLPLFLPFVPTQDGPKAQRPHLSSLAGGLTIRFDVPLEIRGWEWRFGQFFLAPSPIPHSVSGTAGSLYNHSSHWVILLCSFICYCVLITKFLLLLSV